jgi:hypothetical protein
MLKPLTVRVERIFNLGNYESERVDITVELSEGQDLETALDDLRLFIYAHPPVGAKVPMLPGAKYPDVPKADDPF